MTTLAQFRTRVSSKLDLDNTAASAEQILVDSWLNEGIERILIETHCRIGLATMALIADTKDYELPSGVLAIHKIVDANSYPLDSASPEEIYDLRQASAAVTATGAAYFYAVDGSNMLMIHPTPTSADSLSVYYVPRPTALSVSSNDPSTASLGGIPSEFHKLIELYALAEGSDYDDDTSAAQGERYRQMFEQGLVKMKKAQRMKGKRVQPRYPIGQKGRRYVPRVPSQDVW